jgi:hypothetical protein
MRVFLISILSITFFSYLEHGKIINFMKEDGYSQMVNISKEDLLITNQVVQENGSLKMEM